MSNIDKIINQLHKEYQEGKKRQKPRAKRDSGFMSGISRAITIVEEYQKLEQVQKKIDKMENDTSNYNNKKNKYAVKPPYNNPYGVWEVSTEGDCEGKFTKKLGVYSGYIDEIALMLADKCAYSLEFSQLNIIKVDNGVNFTPKCKSVNVTLSIGSGTWDMSANERALAMEEVFKNRPVYIKEAQEYATFCIETIKQTVEEKKQYALSKLTEEEKKLLGLI